MADRGRPPKPPFSPGADSSRPTWTVTRRERTELSPLRTGTPFQSRTVTTTERVQIMQLPLALTEQQIAPAELLALSPTANTSQSVSSTVTTLQAEGTPLIGAMTADGVPVFNGIIPKKKTNYDETKKVIVHVAEDRARQSKKTVQEELDFITEKLAALEAPSVNTAAKAGANGVYSRLTDHTKYTGAHKERFDAEGKGKGKAGRVDLHENTGYVGAYKNKDTYDKAHGKQ